MIQTERELDARYSLLPEALNWWKQNKAINHCVQSVWCWSPFILLIRMLLCYFFFLLILSRAPYLSSDEYSDLWLTFQMQIIHFHPFIRINTILRRTVMGTFRAILCGIQKKIIDLNDLFTLSIDFFSSCAI